MHVGRGTEQLVEQGPTFRLGTRIMWAEQSQKVALCLVGHHLEQVGQVFTLRGEFNDVPLGHRLDLDALGKRTPLGLKLGKTPLGGMDLLTDPAMAILKPRMVGRRLSGLPRAAPP